MEILLTNDDGIYAEGIYQLYKELKKIAKVIVVAPESEKSSVGHGITLAYPIWLQKVKRKDKSFGYGITGTPADCVKFAVAVVMKRKPDLVISGINLGANDGCSVIYSGTVAGAREGAMMGIPSIAISLATFVNPDFSYAAKFGVRLARMILKRKLPNGTYLNVNIPAVKAFQIKGVCITQQGMIPIHGTFRKRVDPNLRTYYWMSGKMPLVGKNYNIDTYALKSRYVTITPVQSDLTNYDFLHELRSWTITK